MKPQEPIPHNYSMRKLNLIFALTSLVLLGTTGLMVMYDYVRGWKWFQLEFNRIQQERIDQQLATLNDAETRKKLAALDQEMREGQVEVAKNREQYVRAKKDLETWEGRHYAADQDYRFAKALLDAKRYEVEASIVQHRHDEKEKRREYDELSAKVGRLNLRLQQVTRDRDAARARVDRFLTRITQIEERKKEISADIDLLKTARSRVVMGGPNLLLNAPMRSEEHTSELQSPCNLVCRLLLAMKTT